MGNFSSSKLVMYVGINNQNLDPNYAGAHIFADKIPHDVKDCFWAAQNQSSFDRCSLFW